MASLRLVSLAASVVLAVSRGGFPGEHHRIKDVYADIRDLDVGDLEDMDSDVSQHWLDELKRSKKKSPSFADMAANPMDFAMASMGGTQMSFAVLKTEYTKQIEAGKYFKDGTKTLAQAWTEMLSIAGINIQVYPTDPGHMLFVTKEGDLLKGVKDFVLQQEEVDYFESNQMKYYPGDRKEALMTNDERRAEEDRLGLRENKKPEPKRVFKKDKEVEKKEAEKKKKRRRRKAGTHTEL